MTARPEPSSCPACTSNRTYRFAWPEGLRYDRCADCACVYRVSTLGLSRDDSQPYRYQHDRYVRSPSSDPAQTYRAREKHYVHILSLLDRHIPCPDPRLLDIGCGHAELLSHLACRGFTDLEGIEPFLDGDPDTPFPVHGCLLEEFARTGPDPFDVITLSAVIEHIPSPMEVIKTAFGMLKPDGVLLMTTANVSAPDKRINQQASRMGLVRRPWRTLAPSMHVVLFSMRSMERIIERAGGEVVEVGTWSFRTKWNVLIGWIRDRLDMGSHVHAAARRRK